jgi:hypothetical protein
VRVPLERDERIRVPGDGLDELDIGAGGDEARYARVAQFVEAVALALEAGGPKRAVPNARCRKFDGWSGVPRIEAKTSSTGA